MNRIHYSSNRILIRGGAFHNTPVFYRILQLKSNNCTISWRETGMGFRVTRLIKNKSI